METLLFWIFLINSVLLINHEIESAYWQEWKLFHIPGGITVFLLLHFPLVFLLLFGLIEVYKQSLLGYVLSIIAGLGGVAAFCIHKYFIIGKGNKEFTLKISTFILWGTLIISLLQIAFSLLIIIK
jgi:hypothetical protein